MGTVEMVARAMCFSEGEDPDTPLVPWHVPIIGPRGYCVAPPNEQVIAAWMVYARQARAAIEAMHEPSGAMIEAGMSAILLRTTGESGEVVREVWRAMTAAMMEQPTKPGEGPDRGFGIREKAAG